MSMRAKTKEQKGRLLHPVSKAGVLLAALLMASSEAHAALSIGTDVSILGSKPASSTTPWVNSVFTDIGNNTVQLTITAPNLTGTEFVQTLYLEFNDLKNVSALNFALVSAQGLSSSVQVGLGQDKFQAGSAGGDFDIQLGFKTGGGLPAQFNGGDQIVFDITTTQANTSLSSLDFAFRSFNNNHPPLYYEAAYIGGIGGHNSGWVAADTFTVLGVPEPASGFIAAVCCFAGLIGVRRVKTVFSGSLA